MSRSRPPWWRPRARRRWDRAEAERKALLALLRRHPGLARRVEALRTAMRAAALDVPRRGR